MKRWHFIILAVAACCMSFSYGYSVSPEPQVTVQKVYVPVCAALPDEIHGHKQKLIKAHFLPKGMKLSELRP